MIFKKFWKNEYRKENNPFAICTAQVGRDSPKYESCVMDLKEKFGIHKDMNEEEYDKEFGIENAGPIPKSELAAQDLETTKSMSREEAVALIGDRADWELQHMKRALSMMAALNTPEEDRRLEAVKTLLSKKKTTIKKGDTLTDTQNKLEILNEEAVDTTSTNETNALVTKLRDVQEKRQNATIQMREKEAAKSIKEVLKGN